MPRSKSKIISDRSQLYLQQFDKSGLLKMAMGCKSLSNSLLCHYYKTDTVS
ncbi:MAG: hypothetical protein ACR2LR_01595 [Hassallia sp.]